MSATSIVQIPLSGGGHALVDDRPDVVQAVAGIRWSVTRWGHVQGHAAGTTQFMHRIVWAVARGHAPAMIDHADRNPRNNTLQNLRAATPSLNVRNNTTTNTFGRGVRQQHSGRYQAQVTMNGGTVALGTFTTAVAAGAAYRIAADRLMAMEAERAARGLAFASDEMPPPKRTTERKAWAAMWRQRLTAPEPSTVTVVTVTPTAPVTVTQRELFTGDAG